MRVDVQDVGLIDFPDDASEEEIQNSLNDLFPAQQPQSRLGDTLFTPPPEIPSYVPATGIPEIPQSLAPQIDWNQRAQAESFVPSKAELQEGVLSTAGITPDIVPPGRKLIESPIGRMVATKAFGDIGAFAPDAVANVVSSAGKTAIGIGEYLSSPQGVTELVASMTPLRLLVLGKWATDMAKGAGQESGALAALLEKPNKTPEDWQAISDHTVNTIAMTFGSGATAKGAASGIKSIAQKLNMPEGKFQIQDRSGPAQDIFNRFELERQIEAGSPFVRRDAPAGDVGMGVRTQPQLGAQPTFEPSGMRLSTPEPARASEAIVEPIISEIAKASEAPKSAEARVKIG